MNIFTKKMLAFAILLVIVVDASADRGVGKKSKNKTTLNIIAPSNIKNAIPLNLKSGLNYTGSLLNTRKTVGNVMMNSSIVTYQKGNATYIVPYKNKITIAEMKQGYTGMKVIIRKK